MNTHTLILLCGIGIGTLIGSAFFFVLMATVTKHMKASSADYNKITTDLMRERNVTDAKIEKHLQAIAGYAERHL